MRTIQKGPEPATLTQYRQQPDAVYDNYGNKADLRAALVAEQRGLCCYCQSRIRATPAHMKIEHWQCQADHPARQLDFSNLLGALRSFRCISSIYPCGSVSNCRIQDHRLFCTSRIR